MISYFGKKFALQCSSPVSMHKYIVHECPYMKYMARKKKLLLKIWLMKPFSSYQKRKFMTANEV